MFLILEKKNGVEFFWTETSTPIKEENLCWLEKGKISFELFDPLRFRFEIIFLDSKISEIPTGYLFYMRFICFHVTLSIHPTLSYG